MRQGEAEPTGEQRAAHRYIDLKRAARKHPKPSPTDDNRTTLLWKRVPHELLSMRFNPALPEICATGSVLTVLDRGELHFLGRRKLVLGLLAAWATLLGVFLYVVGLTGSDLLTRTEWLVVTIVFGVPLLGILGLGRWLWHKGSLRTFNAVRLDPTTNTSTIQWKRGRKTLETSRPLNELVIGLYMVEFYANRIRNDVTQPRNRVECARLDMSSYRRVDRGWIALALDHDLWVALGIDRSPDELRQSLQPLHDIGLEIHEDPTVTVRGFGVKPLRRPGRARFSKRK